MPLHTAYPVTEGLTAVGVLLVGSLLVYRERIRPLAWAGACLVLAGIVLFSL
jgi:multidrug transporter EmrE-like cation transporter